MKQSEAYHLTRKFILNGENLEPEVLSGFYFIKRDSYYILKNIHKSVFFEYTVLSENAFNKRFSNLTIEKLTREGFVLKNPYIREVNEIEYIFNHEKYVYFINQPMALTSQGLAEEEEFELAKEIIENINPIRKKDMKIGSIYKGIDGNFYLYIDKIYGCEDQMISLNKRDYIIYRSSIKLIECVKDITKLTYIGNNVSHIDNLTNTFYTEALDNREELDNELELL